jgi:choline-glycine betaine transporter
MTEQPWPLCHNAAARAHPRQGAQGQRLKTTEGHQAGTQSIDERSKLNPYTFWPGFILLTTGIVLGLTYHEGLAAILDKVMGWIHFNFGWLEVSLGIIIVMFTVGVAFSPIGDIRLGGRDAKPEFSFWQWFALSLMRVSIGSRHPVLGHGENPSTTYAAGP